METTTVSAVRALQMIDEHVYRLRGEIVPLTTILKDGEEIVEELGDATTLRIIADGLRGWHGMTHVLESVHEDGDTRYLWLARIVRPRDAIRGTVEVHTIGPVSTMVRARVIDGDLAGAVDRALKRAYGPRCRVLATDSYGVSIIAQRQGENAEFPIGRARIVAVERGGNERMIARNDLV